MDKEQKKQICSAIHERNEASEAELKIMQESGYPKRVLNMEASILERRKKNFDSYCNSTK